MRSSLPRPIERGLREYARAVEGRFGSRVRHVRLFGSWARGQARTTSDVDVAVVVEGLTRAEWAAAIDDACEVEDATGVALAPYVVSADSFDRLLARERRIARDILHEGIPL